MKELKINHAAVWIAIVVMSAIGFLWYGPLFGDKWMVMVNLDLATIEANPPGFGVWFTNILATVMPAYVMAWLFTKLNVQSLLYGLGIALLISFTFVFLNNMTADMFSHRPYELSWINGGYNLVQISILGLILGGWRKYKE